MVSLLWVVSILQAIVSSQCFLKFTFSTSAGPIKASTARDTDERLFLTPYIRSGRTAEGRRAARVQLPGIALESYAGFFTVDDKHNSNQFLWYFPPTAEPAAKAPVLLWLQGGPGGSSLFGLFMENGPIEFINGSFTLREYHWALNHHVLYIDNPVGAGFSFTDSDDGYCENETQVGEQLYSTLTQFFQLFPELLPNKFFITGESYAGKYIPALAYTIHNKNPSAKTKINLQGLVIGDGWCDPEHQFVYSKHMYQMGIIDWSNKRLTETLESEAIKYIQKRDWHNAMFYWRFIMQQAQVNVYNYSPFSKTLDKYEDTMNMIMSSDIFRKAIHVGQQLFDDKNTLLNDMLQSVAPWISELLDHYRIVFYNGQYDIIVAYPLTINFIEKLRFNGSEEYKSGELREWVVHGPCTTQHGPCRYETAGFWKSGGNLTTVLVRGAGHMVPAEQPAWAHDLITRVTHGGF